MDNRLEALHKTRAFFRRGHRFLALQYQLVLVDDLHVILLESFASAHEEDFDRTAYDVAISKVQISLV